MAFSRKETWPVPYISRLEGGGIKPGQSVVIQGVVRGERFAINLASGRTYEDGCALHLSIRPKDGHIMLNSFRGEWGKEQKAKCHWKEGDEFDLRIRAHEDKFEIFADQKELTTMEYREHLSTINHLLIEGSISLSMVNWGGSYYTVPYEARIEGGFRPGKRLYVSGVPEGKKFSINLMHGADTIMHVNPRFNENVIVRNAQMGGEWGVEELDGKLFKDFDRKHAFDIIIENDAYAFQIYVNGVFFGSFGHRVETVPDTLKIDGEVELQGVHIE